MRTNLSRIWREEMLKIHVKLQISPHCEFKQLIVGENSNWTLGEVKFSLNYGRFPKNALTSEIVDASLRNNFA